MPATSRGSKTAIDPNASYTTGFVGGGVGDYSSPGTMSNNEMSYQQQRIGEDVEAEKRKDTWNTVTENIPLIGDAIGSAAQMVMGENEIHKAGERAYEKQLYNQRMASLNWK